jgi:hypothetical protein
MQFDPTKIRVSKHFILSDFLGNHSVYTRGIPNMLDPHDPELPLKMANLHALCDEFLEPFLEQAGPLSISYSYITPELSDEIVHYQDSRKPSHHQFNLGAAADIISHEWVNADPEDDSATSAPVMLAHEIASSGYPLSRLITYSESPYLCVAVSASEVAEGKPRGAFYENRYTGHKGEKPDYRKYPSPAAKHGALAALVKEGLSHGWRGQGYPSYHGHGRRQYHHIRVSDYSMLSDWLFDLQSVANGAKNIPNVQNPNLMESFYLAGDLYDSLIKEGGHNRYSIISGYVDHANPSFVKENDWARGQGWFTVVMPEGVEVAQVMTNMTPATATQPIWEHAYIQDMGEGKMRVHFQQQ